MKPRYLKNGALEMKLGISDQSLQKIAKTLVTAGEHILDTIQEDLKSIAESYLKKGIQESFNSIEPKYMFHFLTRYWEEAEQEVVNQFSNALTSDGDGELLEIATENAHSYFWAAAEEELGYSPYREQRP